MIKQIMIHCMIHVYNQVFVESIDLYIKLWCQLLNLAQFQKCHIYYS